jgi:deoxycytidylate deaminase
MESDLSNKEKAYLSVARYFASKSKARRMHGAVVVKSGRVVGTGFNKDRNNPYYVSPEHIKSHCSVHAEVDAIRDANWNVKGAVLYVARVNSHGQDRDSKPCIRCQVVIEEAQIKKVIYTESESHNDD